VAKNWVEQSTKAENKNGSVKYYQHQWWLPTANGDFMAEGILGQFVYVNPSKNLIIVRLGKNEGSADWWNIFTTLASAY
jgi:CubicO group peptidase (beta-lactamase class C family)